MPQNASSGISMEASAPKAETEAALNDIGELKQLESDEENCFENNSEQTFHAGNPGCSRHLEAKNEQKRESANKSSDQTSQVDAEDEHEDEDDDEDLLPLFSVLSLFGLALICIGGFLQIPKIKNNSIGIMFAIAFGTIPVIAFTLVLIWGYNKKKKGMSTGGGARFRSSSSKLTSNQHDIQIFTNDTMTTNDAGIKKSQENIHLQDFDTFLKFYNAAKDIRVPKNPYPEDSYSFLAFYHPRHNFRLFAFGLVVFLFQFTLLLLMALNVVVPELRTTGEIDNTASGAWIGNEIFPSNSGRLVRTTQVLSLMAFVFFPEQTLLDITAAVELFPWGVLDSPGEWKLRGLRISCTLRFIQSLLSALAVWLLVMTASDVVDIILNFTAINFISNLDNHAFHLALGGKYGKRINNAAEEIKNQNLPHCIGAHSKGTRYKIAIIITCFVLYVASVGVMLTQDNSNQWVTPLVRVEFKDKTREAYSGCYHISKDAHYQRYIWKGDDANKDSRAKIGYCLKKRRWLLFLSGDDPCKALGTENEIAHSAQTDSYEIQSSISEDWFTAFNTPIDNMYFIQVENIDELAKSCNSFPGDGKCDPFLNNFDYQYDGGDCCAAGTTDYPNCIDPTMTTLTLQFDNNTEDISRLRLHCESDEDTELFNIEYSSAIPLILKQGYTCTLKSATELEELSPEQRYNITLGYNLSLANPVSKFNTTSFIVHPPMLTRQNTFLSQHFIHYADDLKGLDLGGKGIAGTIPSEMGLLTGLDWLFLAENNFSGEIPSEIGMMTGLGSIWLYENELTGSIPVEVGELSELTVLDLGYNDLTGTIPSEIGDLTVLEYLVFDFNWLTGTVPSEVGQLTELKRLAFGFNDLTGALPSEIGHMTDLTAIFLYVNFFTGTIPSQIGLLTGLEALHIFRNEFTGAFPREIWDLKALIILSAYENEFTGVIPVEIGELTSLQQLELYINGFSGPIPSQIGQLTALTTLDLDNNGFSGSIPSQIGQLTALNTLYLADNKFTGEIPSELQLLTGLQELDLSGNRFTGTIPANLPKTTTHFVRDNW